MRVEAADDIAAYLRDHRHFEECILEDVRWRHYGTVIELVFDYIWLEDGTVRPDYLPPKLEVLVLRNVQEAHIVNDLTEYMALHPDEIDWGISEVSSVRLVDDESVLARYSSVAVPFHHLRCNWETKRRIDITFSTLEIGTGRA